MFSKCPSTDELLNILHCSQQDKESTRNQPTMGPDNVKPTCFDMTSSSHPWPFPFPVERNIAFRKFKINLIIDPGPYSLFKVLGRLVNPAVKTLMDHLLDPNLYTSSTVEDLANQINKFTNYVKVDLHPASMVDIEDTLVDEYMERLLPKALRDCLTPLFCEKSNLSFWSSVSVGVFATPVCGELLRLSTIYYVVSEKNSAQNICDSFKKNSHYVFLSLQNGEPPFDVSKSILSNVLDKNITELVFDTDGNLTSSMFYEPLLRNIAHEETVYVGRFGSMYFPLMKKHKTSGLSKVTISALTQQIILQCDTARDETHHKNPEPKYKEPFLTSQHARKSGKHHKDGIRPKMKKSEVHQQSHKTNFTKMDARNVFSQEGVSSSQETVVWSVPVPVISVFVWNSIPVRDMFYNSERYAQNILNYPVLKQMFLSCTKCENNSQTVCEHAEQSSFQGSQKLQQLFRSRFNKNILVKNVPETLPTVKLPNQLKKCFVAYTVEADGNCFFSAVSFVLCLEELFSKAIRRSGYLTLKLDKVLQEKLHPTEKVQLDAQKSILGTDGKWADCHTMFITSYVVSRPIIVFSYSLDGSGTIDGTLFDAKEDEKAAPVYLWLSGNHFVPLIITSSHPGPPQFKFKTSIFRKTHRKNELSKFLKSCGFTLESTNFWPTQTIEDDSDDDVAFNSKFCGQFPVSVCQQFKKNYENSPKKDEKSFACDENAETFQDFKESVENKESSINHDSTRLKYTLKRQPLNEKQRPSVSGGRFVSSDDRCYEKVLKHLKLDFEEFSFGNQQAVFAEIEKCVQKLSHWEPYLKKMLEKRKLSKKQQSNISAVIYNKQRFIDGRLQFLKMMQSAGIGDLAIDYYMDVCNLHFGKLHLPLDSLTFSSFQGPLNPIHVKSSATLQKVNLEFQASENNYAQPNYEDTTNMPDNLPMAELETLLTKASKSPILSEVASANENEDNLDKKLSSESIPELDNFDDSLPEPSMMSNSDFKDIPEKDTVPSPTIKKGSRRERKSQAS